MFLMTLLMISSLLPKKDIQDFFDFLQNQQLFLIHQSDLHIDSVCVCLCEWWIYRKYDFFFLFTVVAVILLMMMKILNHSTFWYLGVIQKNVSKSFFPLIKIDMYVTIMVVNNNFWCEVHTRKQIFFGFSKKWKFSHVFFSFTD